MKKLIIIVLLLGAVSCSRKMNEYILPCDFEGVVITFYNIKEGNDDRMINDKITYKIQKDGVYYTKNKFPSGSLVEFYRICNGNKIKIEDYTYLEYHNNFTMKDTIFALSEEYRAHEKADYKGYKVEASISLIGRDTSRVAVERMRGEGRKIFDSISEIIFDKRLLQQ